MQSSRTNFIRQNPFEKGAIVELKNTRLLLENGSAMACGNDGGIQSCTPAMIAHELAIFDLFINGDETHKVFDSVKAVQTATINSAVSMGIEDCAGSIQTGKIADLVILDGNPFQDMSLIGKPVDALFVEGCLSIDNCGLHP